jgi:hypothetical protein
MSADDLTRMRADIEEPKRPSTTVYLIVFLVSFFLLACCCLVLILAAAWIYGDSVVESFSFAPGVFNLI